MINIEEKMPHMVSEVICIGCKHRWISVRPEITLLKDLECPECGNVGFVIETGQSLDAMADIHCMDCRHFLGDTCKLRIQDYKNCMYYEQRPM